MSLTLPGERLLQLGREVLKPVALAEQKVRRGVAAERTRLRVATQCYTAYHWLPSAIEALIAEHPNVDLVLVNEPPANFAAALTEGQLELGLCISLPRAARLERVSLFDDELVLAVRAATVWPRALSRKAPTWFGKR